MYLLASHSATRRRSLSGELPLRHLTQQKLPRDRPSVMDRANEYRVRGSGVEAEMQDSRISAPGEVIVHLAGRGETTSQDLDKGLFAEIGADDVTVVTRDDEPILVAHGYTSGVVLASKLGQVGTQDRALTPT